MITLSSPWTALFQTTSSGIDLASVLGWIGVVATVVFGAVAIVVSVALDARSRASQKAAIEALAEVRSTTSRIDGSVRHIDDVIRVLHDQLFSLIDESYRNLLSVVIENRGEMKVVQRTQTESTSDRAPTAVDEASLLDMIRTLQRDGQSLTAGRIASVAGGEAALYSTVQSLYTMRVRRMVDWKDAVLTPDTVIEVLVP